MPANRRGVTLVELIAALSVGALVLLLAHALLATLADAATRMDQRISEEEEQVLALAEAATAIRTARGRESGGGPFFGDAQSAEFDGLCIGGGGWWRTCRTQIAIRTVHDSAFLHVSASDRPGRIALRLRAPAVLRYRLRTEHAASWLPAWGLAIAAPAALAVVSANDTIVLGAVIR